MILNCQILQRMIFALLPLLIAGCSHRVMETSQPTTNHPDVIRHEKEWEADENEPVWKVSMYEVLKECADEQ